MNYVTNRHPSLSHRAVEEVYTRLVASTRNLSMAEIQHNKAVAKHDQAKADVTNAGLEGSNADMRKAYLLEQTEDERNFVTFTKMAVDTSRLEHDINRLMLREIELHARLAEIEHEEEKLRLRTRSPRRRRRR